MSQSEDVACGTGAETATPAGATRTYAWRDLWICSAVHQGNRWGVKHHRVRMVARDWWENERGDYVTCTDSGIGHGNTREEAVQSYLAYLKGLCDEARSLLEKREEAYRAVEALSATGGEG